MVNKYSGSGRKREKGMHDGDGDGRGGRCKNYDTEGETAVTAVIENLDASQVTDVGGARERCAHQ